MIVLIYYHFGFAIIVSKSKPGVVPVWLRYGISWKNFQLVSRKIGVW